MKQSYDLGKGPVTIGTKILYFPPGERILSGTVTDISQDGDVTIQSDLEPNKQITTKWRYVEPKGKRYVY